MLMCNVHLLNHLINNYIVLQYIYKLSQAELVFIFGFLHPPTRESTEK